MIAPGHTAFTRIPCGANRTAAFFVQTSSAAFITE